MFHFLFFQGVLLAAFTAWFTISCFRENTPQAGRRGLTAVALLVVLTGAYAWLHISGRLEGPEMEMLQTAVGVATASFMVSMFLPLGRRPESRKGTAGMRCGPPEKFDQKDTVFNIAHVGGFGRKVAAYRWALQSRDPMGGLYWTLVMGLRNFAEGKIKSLNRQPIGREEAAREIKRVARYLGADLVGITTVKDDFTYSHGFSYEESRLGVGPAVSKPVVQHYKYLISLAKEMDFKTIQKTLTEENDWSTGEIGKTYYEVAAVACGLASYIRNLGYAARAHHLRNEQVFQVPHAVDAGIGEQGRHGYVITKQFGPRVRLASVTTDLELLEDKPVDIGVQHFCEICRACETNCPANAISAQKKEVRGYRRWFQSQTKCFGFWTTGGNTYSCTLCLKVCPWNKPRTFVHRVSFEAAARSWLGRWVLYLISVAFYGRICPWVKQPLPEKVELPPEIQELIANGPVD
jgi:reductive dehalogenase